MSPGLKSGGWKFGRRELRPTDEICSVSFESSSATDATSAKWYETFATNVASSRSPRRSWVVKHLPETQLRPQKSRRPGGDPTVGREIHRCPRHECRSKGRHRFPWYSKAARGAGGSDRKHERVRSRMTSQGLVDAVAGDPRTDRHLDVDIDARLTNHFAAQPVFLRGRLVQTHLDSERGKVKLSPSEAAREEALLTLPRHALDLRK